MSDHRIALGVHAERLHDTAIWRRLDRLLARLEPSGVRLTFFVHPFEATRAGITLEDAVATLAGRGHELGQHTHYYDRAAFGGPDGKRTLLSDANVNECLSADRDHLRSLGVEPRGFVGGAWAVPAAAFDWLERAGFDYDCTYRTFALRFPSPSAEPGQSDGIPFLRGGLLELPTTAPARRACLDRALRRDSHAVTLGAVTYESIYVHDYDLAEWSQRASMRLIGRIAAGAGGDGTVGDLARVVRAELAQGLADPNRPR